MIGLTFWHSIHEKLRWWRLAGDENTIPRSQYEHWLEYTENIIRPACMLICMVLGTEYLLKTKDCRQIGSRQHSIRQVVRKDVVYSNECKWFGAVALWMSIISPSGCCAKCNRKELGKAEIDKGWTFARYRFPHWILFLKDMANRYWYRTKARSKFTTTHSVMLIEWALSANWADMMMYVLPAVVPTLHISPSQRRLDGGVCSRHLKYVQEMATYQRYT